MRLAVFKSGDPEARNAVEFMRKFPQISPEVYSHDDDSYVMECLDEWVPSVYDTITVEAALENRVWSVRPSGPSDDNWPNVLRERFGVSVPSWAREGTPACIHGDPTFSNLLRRGSGVVISDPIQRTYIPSFSEVDMGKILQSVMGWESVAYGEDHLRYYCPRFWGDPEKRRRALFWCAVHCARILVRENGRRQHVEEWCDSTMNRCFDVAGV